MDSYLNYSGGKMNTGIYLPDNYSESATYEILIALPGAGDPKLNGSVRDHLIPVSESRNSIILTPDFPKAAQPLYLFDNPGQINEVIGYARTRFSVDLARIYLMCAGCQGQPVLKGTQSGVFHVKGAIAVNPEIQSFQPDEWSGKLKPLAIASSLTDPFYPHFEAFADRLWQDGNKIKLFPFNGPGSDYLTDELADLTIRCMNYIDSVNFLSTVTDLETGGKQSTIKVIGSGTNSRFGISAISGEQLNIRLIDIDGRISYPVYQGQMISWYMEVPVYQWDSIRSGIYLVRLAGSESGINGIKILVNKN